ncbi:histidine kinase, partial [Mycobacterium sp. ITM-2017-0098]
LVQNLLSNALKFVATDVPPVIRVSAARDIDAWRFTVEDNGIGIAEVHRERIFLMFKRLHGRSEYPGTGIGLA